jgi:hypothetical protein
MLVWNYWHKQINKVVSFPKHSDTKTRREVNVKPNVFLVLKLYRAKWLVSRSSNFTRCESSPSLHPVQHRTEPVVEANKKVLTQPGIKVWSSRCTQAFTSLDYLLHLLKHNSWYIARISIYTLFRVVFWVILPCKMIIGRRFCGAYAHHQHHLLKSFYTALYPTPQLWTCSKCIYSCITYSGQLFQDICMYFRYIFYGSGL